MRVHISSRYLAGVFAVLCLMAVSGCQESPESEVRNGIFLPQTIYTEDHREIGNESVGYVLDIPSEYLWNKRGYRSTYRGVSFMYPSGDPVPGDHGGWDAEIDGSPATLVRVLLRYYGPTYKKNKNHYGRFFYETQYYEAVQIHNDIESSRLELPDGDFKCFDRISGEDQTFGCAFLLEANRFGYLDCGMLYCQVDTSWKEKFAVTYAFSRKFTNELSNIDKDVRALISKSGPKLVTNN